MRPVSGLGSPAAWKNRDFAPTSTHARTHARVCAHLKAIMAYPPTTQLSLEEKDLLWRFRFFLTREKKVTCSCIGLVAATRAAI